MAIQFLPPLYEWMEGMASQTSSSPQHGCTAVAEALLFCFAKKDSDPGQERLARVL